jgi:tRNA 2-thiouridine synthesizing protein A
MDESNPKSGYNTRMSVDEPEIEVLDLLGLKCPLPALYARRALERALPGATVAVICDDPLAAVDLPHMCRTEGFAVVSITKDGAMVRAVLQRPAA